MDQKTSFGCTRWYQILCVQYWANYTGNASHGNGICSILIFHVNYSKFQLSFECPYPGITIQTQKEAPWMFQRNEIVFTPMSGQYTHWVFGNHDLAMTWPTEQQLPSNISNLRAIWVWKDRQTHRRSEWRTSGIVLLSIFYVVDLI